MSAPHLPGLLQNLAPVLDNYGYAGVGALVFLEDFGVPVPGETMLIAAAVYAYQGQLNLLAVAVIAFVAAVVGDNVGFAIGHFGGRELVLRWGRYVFITEERLDKAQGFFDRHGGKVVTIARFVEGLRQANGIIAGIVGMRWLKFLAYNALGAALWVALWTVVGYEAGSQITTVYHTVVRYEVYFGVALVVLIAALVGRRLWKRHRRRAEERSPT